MLTTDQVTALVPDAASFKAGKALAVTRKWSALGGDENIIWGLAQGSGKNPYQTQVALGKLAYKCSCPSRKFPCKHAIGLMFLAAEDASVLTAKEQPDWVKEWLQAREANQQKAEARAESKAQEKPKDEKAAAKRQEKKAARIEEGVAHLQKVLLDLVNSGIGREEVSNRTFWDSLSRRLVDAQAPGLAGYVRRLGELPDSQLGWESRLLHELGSLHALLNAYTTLESQGTDLQDELRQLIGVSADKDAILSQAGVKDRWFVAARRQTEQDRLITSATWLYGQDTGRWGMKLEFAAPPSLPKEHWPVGATVTAEFVYYPGILPDRILPRSDSVSAQIQSVPQPSFSNVEAMLAQYASQLAANPWRSRMPFLMRLQPGHHNAQLHLVDASGVGLPCKCSADIELQLISLSGGRPTLICGEWNGYQAQALSMAEGGAWLGLQEALS